MLLFTLRKGRWTRRCFHAFVHIEEKTMDEEVFPCFCSYLGKDNGRGGVSMLLFTLRKGGWTRRFSHVFIHIEERTMDVIFKGPWPLGKGRWIRVQKRTTNEEGAHMCLSRLREGRWISVQKRTINEDVLPCVCPG